MISWSQKKKKNYKTASTWQLGIHHKGGPRGRHLSPPAEAKTFLFFLFFLNGAQTGFSILRDTTVHVHNIYILYMTTKMKQHISLPSWKLTSPSTNQINYIHTYIHTDRIGSSNSNSNSNSVRWKGGGKRACGGTKVRSGEIWYSQQEVFVLKLNLDELKASTFTDFLV